MLSSVQVAFLAMKPGPPPLSAVLRAHLAVKSDLVLALAVNIFNLIPGSIVLEIDQSRRMLYMHVIDVGNERAVDRFYRQVNEVERLLVATFEREKDWRPLQRQGERMTVVWVAAAVMLTAAAGVTMFRLLAGPSTLDRLVALDTLVAVTMCGSAPGPPSASTPQSPTAWPRWR